MGGAEEDRFVAAPGASLRRYHPCEQRTLARGPVLRQSGSHPSAKARTDGAPGYVGYRFRDPWSDMVLNICLLPYAFFMGWLLK